MAGARESDRRARLDHARTGRCAVAPGATRAVEASRRDSEYFRSGYGGVRIAMRNLLTGLDVGTSKVCALVGEALADGQLATLGYGVSPCTGLRKGVVVNIEATVESIKSAVEE